MDKNVEISLLLSFYGNILTEKQQEATSLYYNEDLSLAEISEIVGITRQGVRDNIKRAESVLYDMEAKLGLCKRFLGVKQKLETVDDELKNMEVLLKGNEIAEEVKVGVKNIIKIVYEINENL